MTDPLDDLKVGGYSKHQLENAVRQYIAARVADEDRRIKAVARSSMEARKHRVEEANEIGRSLLELDEIPKSMQFEVSCLDLIGRAERVENLDSLSRLSMMAGLRKPNQGDEPSSG